jgi:hypothetical protein
VRNGLRDSKYSSYFLMNTLFSSRVVPLNMGCFGASYALTMYGILPDTSSIVMSDFTEFVRGRLKDSALCRLTASARYELHSPLNGPNGSLISWHLSVPRDVVPSSSLSSRLDTYLQ